MQPKPLVSGIRNHSFPSTREHKTTSNVAHTSDRYRWHGEIVGRTSSEFFWGVFLRIPIHIFSSNVAIRFPSPCDPVIFGKGTPFCQTQWIVKFCFNNEFSKLSWTNPHRWKQQRIFVKELDRIRMLFRFNKFSDNTSWQLHLAPFKFKLKTKYCDWNTKIKCIIFDLFASWTCKSSSDFGSSTENSNDWCASLSKRCGVETKSWIFKHEIPLRNSSTKMFEVLKPYDQRNFGWETSELQGFKKWSRIDA